MVTEKKFYNIDSSCQCYKTFLIQQSNTFSPTICDKPGKELQRLHFPGTGLVRVEISLMSLAPVEFEEFVDIPVSVLLVFVQMLLVR
jgi:hypothetical protein